MSLADPSTSAGGEVRVALLRLDRELPPPSYAHPGDAGADQTALALQDGYAAFVHPRSGLAAKHGVSIVNAPGTVDAGYRGEIKVCLVNLDPHAEVTLRRGDRIAQLVIQQVEKARFVEVTSLPGSARGDGGYGSTGGFGDVTR